jgi:hypothetical protein
MIGTRRSHASPPPFTNTNNSSYQRRGQRMVIVVHLLLSDVLTQHQSSAAKQTTRVSAPHLFVIIVRRAYRRGSVPKPARYQRHLVLVIQGTSSNALWRIPWPCVFHLILSLPVHANGW